MAVPLSHALVSLSFGLSPLLACTDQGGDDPRTAAIDDIERC